MPVETSNPKLFGTDGIRTRFGESPLTPHELPQLGQAIGRCLAEPGESMLLGWDPRQSSREIVERLTRGLADAHIEVSWLGEVPTPVVARTIAAINDGRGRLSEFRAGIMVSASHNEWQDNGIKIFGHDGHKLPDGDQDKITDIFYEIRDKAGVPTPEPDSPTDRWLPNAPSRYFDPNLYAEDLSPGIRNKHISYLVRSAEGMDFGGEKAVIDAANGAASKFARLVFSELNIDVISIFDRPNGKNINDGCGATDTKALREAVAKNKAAFGLAFDGDADRLAVVDSRGNELNGDHIMYILASVNRYKQVAATVMTNMGIAEALREQGVELHRTDVGDRHLLAEMQKKPEIDVAGEQSGHIILPQRLESGSMFMSGDGMLAAIRLMQAVRKSGITLDEWHDRLAVRQFDQSLINVPVSDRSVLERPGVVEYIRQQAAKLGGNVQDIAWSSGTEFEGPDWRVFARPSGTEQVVRVMVETKEKGAATAHAHRIAEELANIA